VTPTLTFEWTPQDSRALQRLVWIRSRTLRVDAAVLVVSIVLSVLVSAIFVFLVIFCLAAMIGITVRTLWPSMILPEGPTTVEIGDEALRVRRATPSGSRREVVVNRADIERLSVQGRFVLVQTRDETIGTLILPRSALADDPEAAEALDRLAAAPEA
jgi:hypothetical protein